MRLKYPGLAPWEIWLSEAQERMVLAVPPDRLAELYHACVTFSTWNGAISAHSPVRAGWWCAIAARLVLDLENDFLHDGIPQRSCWRIYPTFPQ